MRKVLIGIAVTLLVLIGIGAFALSRLDPNDYVDLIDAKVQQATGRELKIDGKVGYTLSLRPTIAAESIRFQNAPWGSRPDMATVKRVEIRIALLPLLRGNVEVRGLTLIEPDVLLEIGRDGAKNWEFKPRNEKKPAPAAGSTQQIDVRKARIEKGTITYRDIKAKRESRVGLEHIALSGSGSELQLEGIAQFNAVPVEIDAALDHGGHLGKTGATGKSRIVLSAPGIKLTGNGAVPIGGGLDGLDLQVDTEVSNWSTVAKLTQDAPMKLPVLKAQAFARAKADVLLIDELKATLGRSSATGQLRIGMGDKSDLDARLDSPFVDLVELQGPAQPSKPSPDGRIFSAEPFELAGLRKLSGKADLRIAKLALRDGKTLNGLNAQATFDHGKVVADPVRILVEGRELRIRLNADASSGKAGALNLAVDGQGIPIGALTAMLNVSGAPEGGPTDLSIRLSGAGNSVRSLIAGANGDVRISIGPGRMKTQAITYGADVTELLNAINPARKADPYTELKCAVIRLPIRQGVARIDNGIAAETSKVHVIGGGVIDFRNETLDLGFRPKAVTGLGVGLGGLASLGRLRGSLSDPQVEIDAAGAATAAANVGMAIMSGGLSLLGTSLITDSVPDHPCQAALTGVVRQQKAEAKENPGIIDSVVGGLKRLFGQ